VARKTPAEAGGEVRKRLCADRMEGKRPLDSQRVRCCSSRLLRRHRCGLLAQFRHFDVNFFGFRFVGCDPWRTDRRSLGVSGATDQWPLCMRPAGRSACRSSDRRSEIPQREVPMDTFWDRRTNFWTDNEAPRSGARSKLASVVSRRSRRLRAQSRRRKLASLYALASLVLLVVFVHGLVASDVGHGPGGGREARAADGARAGGGASGSSQGPVVDARPVASVTGAPPDLGATPAAPAAGGVAPSPAPVGSSGGGQTATPASSSSTASAPARAPAPSPLPAPTPAPIPTTSPAPITAPVPPCTIGLLGTCILDNGGGGLLP
jgi:hypothetical protein